MNTNNFKVDSVVSSSVVERFKSFYSNLILIEAAGSNNEWAELDGIYTDDIYFRDPVHIVEGKASLHHYLSDMCESLQECRFVYLDEVILDGTAYIKWDMYFRHPKFGEKTIRVRGVSQVEFDKRGIYFHEDFYDMGAMLYENIPLIGGGVRWLKRRLVQTST